MNKQQAYSDIKNFLIKAGDYALENQTGIKRNYKEGEQALTETDLAVSKIAQEDFADWLSQDGHILIDEESITLTPEEAFASSKYQWVLDPIDGTAGYALGREMWGVSLGLLENGKPIIGGIYLPVQKKLLIADENAAHIINLNLVEQEPIKAELMEVNSQIYVESFLGFDRHWGTDMSENKVWLNTPECAVQAFYSTYTNQSAGASFYQIFSLWDIAGSAAIAQHSGHKIMSLDDGREWERFTAQDFSDKWKLKEAWLLCHPDNFEYIRTAIKG